MVLVVQEGGVSRPEWRLPAQPWPCHCLGVLAQTLAMAVIKLPLFWAPPRPAEHVCLTVASSVSSTTKESSHRAANQPREHRLLRLRPSSSMALPSL
jgi:hypothetical protein